MSSWASDSFVMGSELWAKYWKKQRFHYILFFSPPASAIFVCGGVVVGAHLLAVLLQPLADRFEALQRLRGLEKVYIRTSVLLRT